MPHSGFLPQTWNVTFPAVRIESAFSMLCLLILSPARRDRGKNHFKDTD